MGDRRERRQAELAAKKAAKKAGLAFDPTPFKVVAPQPEPAADPDDFYPAHLATDPLAEFVGVDAKDRYIGETGRISSDWQEHHAHCEHGFTTGNWWLLIGDDADVVEVPSIAAAIKALRAAGATWFLPVEEDPDAEDEDADLPDRHAKWRGLDDEGYIVSEAGEIDDDWMEHWAYDASDFTIGKWWVSVDRDEPVEVADKDAAFKIMLAAGAVSMMSAIPPDEALEYAGPEPELVGVDAADHVIGEAGEVDEEWQKRHAACGHGFTTGNWWVGVKGDEMVEVVDMKAACEALFAAGAVRIHETPDDDADEDEADPDEEGAAPRPP